MAEQRDNQAQIDEYTSQANQKKREMEAQQELRRSYMATADEIGEAYERLARDKAVARERRDELKSFQGETYDRFQGDLFSKTYQPSVQAIVSSYDNLIARIDQNLDALNNKRRELENKAYECDGIIGVLEQGINYLYRSIQNLVN